MTYWSIVEQQHGPECAMEAFENLLQCYLPLPNVFSDHGLKRLAQQSGYLLPDGALDVNGYVPLLQKFRITAQWYAFDHGELISALKQHRRVIALVDAYQIDPLNYSPESGHAIVLTRSVTDQQHSIIYAYKGLDSNFAGQERQWDAAAMERAADYFTPSSLLIVDQAVPVHMRKPHLVRLPRLR